MPARTPATGCEREAAAPSDGRRAPGLCVPRARGPANRARAAPRARACVRAGRSLSARRPPRPLRARGKAAGAPAAQLCVSARRRRFQLARMPGLSPSGACGALRASTAPGDATESASPRQGPDYAPPARRRADALTTHPSPVYALYCLHSPVHVALLLPDNVQTQHSHALPPPPAHDMPSYLTHPGPLQAAARERWHHPPPCLLTPMFCNTTPVL
jgi:hypothetical protein